MIGIVCGVSHIQKLTLDGRSNDAQRAVRSDALVAFSAGVAVSGDDSCNMRAMSVVIIKVRTMVYGIHKGF